jgi:hypothetical protein
MVTFSKSAKQHSSARVKLIHYVRGGAAAESSTFLASPLQYCSPIWQQGNIVVVHVRSLFQLFCVDF